MKLRNQLLLLSLAILSLPWAGCEYVREMERVMLDGQEREMLASARAVALMLGEQPTLFSGADETTTTDSIYFHNLPSIPQLDGYLDEWRDWPIEPIAMRPIDPSREPAYAENEVVAMVRSGFISGSLYLHVDISDPSPAFSDPSIDPLESGDFLQIVRQNEPPINISVSSPGTIVGRYLDSQGRIVREFGVSGYWVDSGRGHQIEIRINPAILNGRIGLRYADKNIRVGRFLSELELGIETRTSEPYYYASANPSLANSINFFASTDLRLAISDRAGWVLASGGNLQPITWVTEQNGITSWLYSLVLRTNSEPEIDNWQQQGRFNTLDVTSALLGHIRASSYSLDGARILRAVYPIERGGEVLGAVIVEKSSAEVITATDSAFSRLLFWVLVVILVVIVGLLTYASILSIRVRRLSTAAEEAMDDPASGQLAERFPVSKMGDELGDLSRSYAELLHRLDEHTIYLKTLASKLSHELRTPLAIIRSSLDNLENQGISESGRVYSERASDGVARLSATLNAMSGASRLEESTKNAELEKVNMTELLESVTAGYRDTYPASQFQLELPENEDCHLDVAPDLILQMLDKLVDNARDFCTEGEAITLGLTKADLILSLTVSNSGPLLPDNMRTKLFDSLVSMRSGSSETPHLGLGLHIVRLVAEAHEAKVSAFNLSDQSGVCFQVDFQLKIS